MKTLRCSLSYCDERLNSAKAVAIGLCDRHLDDLAHTRSYVGFCWNCSRITLIDFPHRRLAPVWRDKYLVTAACAHCTGESKDDVAWITWSKFNPEPSLVITAEGKLKKVSKDNKSQEIHQTSQLSRKEYL